MFLQWRKWHLVSRGLSLGVGLVVTGGVAGGLAQSAAAATVTVKPGQTLTEIADHYGVTVAALAAANGIANPNRVLAGQQLKVPGTPAPSSGGAGQVVVVQPGQTLTEIAEHYGVTVAALAAANGIADPNLVMAGSHLTIPSPAQGSGMQLTSYSVPGAAGGLPAQLVANPGRLSLAPDFVSAATTFGIPPALLEAMCWWESGWQEDVVSVSGAIGVCQIEPATAAFVNQNLVGVALNPQVASQNIRLGAALLGSLLEATGGNVGQALAGYYQGLASVREQGMLPATVTYVKGVEGYAAIFSSAS